MNEEELYIDATNGLRSVLYNSVKRFDVADSRGGSATPQD